MWAHGADVNHHPCWDWMVPVKWVFCFPDVDEAEALSSWEDVGEYGPCGAWLEDPSGDRDLQKSRLCVSLTWKRFQVSGSVLSLWTFFFKTLQDWWSQPVRFRRPETGASSPPLGTFRLQNTSRGFCRGVRLTSVTVVRRHDEKLPYKNCWTVSL